MSELERATYSPQEAARKLGICERSVYEALKKKRIPHIRFGRRYVIPREAFDKWLASVSVPSMLEYRA